MSDIVERLRAGTGGGKHWVDLHIEAADEIERLRVMIAKAKEHREAKERAAQPADLIPQDALFVCGQMGAHVTRVRVEQPAPAAVPPGYAATHQGGAQ